MLKTVLLIFLVVNFAQAEIYAVLGAGSREFINYRHQADICHAYQILVRNGIPQENIIVFAYNDIAYNPMNYFLGTLFNQPSNKGDRVDNVYDGCMIDYEGDDVTPENFVAVLTGDKNGVKGGNGRVLESGENDQVFINFVDHGAPGMIVFPEIGEYPEQISQYFYADDMNKLLKDMQDKKKYKEITFYLETCYSGSMFEETPTDMKVYAVTSANPTQSSFATYCHPKDIVQGKSMHTCLGDLFSVNWMQNTERFDLSTESLQEQFLRVRDKVIPNSIVSQWGDLSFTDEPIGSFLGGNDSNGKNTSFLKKIQDIISNSTNEDYYDKQNVKEQQELGIENVNDTQLTFLTQQFQRNPSQQNYKRLNDELSSNLRFKTVFQNFKNQYGGYLRRANQSGKGTNFKCYKFLVTQLEQQYGMLNDFSRKNLQMFYDFCKIAELEIYQNVQLQLYI